MLKKQLIINNGSYMRVKYRQDLVNQIKGTPQCFVEEKLRAIKLPTFMQKIILMRFCQYISIKELIGILNLSSMTITRKTQKALDLIKRSGVFDE